MKNEKRKYLRPVNLSDKEMTRNFLFEKEKWRRIKDYPNYFVSSLGNLFCINGDNAFTARLVKPNAHGYFVVYLRNEKGQKLFRLNRLILMAFTNRWDTDLLACHRNDIKTDNRIENLYWGTEADNGSDRAKNNLSTKGEKHWAAKLKEEDVLYIRKNYLRTAYHKSNAKELAKKFNINHVLVLLIVKGKIWSHI